MLEMEGKRGAMEKAGRISGRTPSPTRFAERVIRIPMGHDFLPR